MKYVILYGWNIYIVIFTNISVIISLIIPEIKTLKMVL